MKAIKNSRNQKLVIKEVREKKSLDVPAYFGINFEGGGYVIIAAEKGVHPIIRFSKSMSFNEERIDESISKWLECVKNNIENVRYRKKLKQKPEIVSPNYIQNQIAGIRDFPIPIDKGVPSLFEKYQTSRWAYWDPYTLEFPNQDGANTCVPVAMAQIIKYHCGIAVNMQWGGAGTGGTPGTWANAMANYFNYSSNWTYRDQNYIANNKEAFKSSLKSELIVRGNVKEGHRTYSAFQPKSFMQKLFSNAEILDHIIEKRPIGKWIPHDIWIVKKCS